MSPTNPKLWNDCMSNPDATRKQKHGFQKAKKNKKAKATPYSGPRNLLKNGLLQLNTLPGDHRTILADQNRTKSPLLRLPSELRNQIFRHALCDQYIFIQRRIPHETHHHRRRKVFKLFATSRCKFDFLYPPPVKNLVWNGQYKTISRVCRQLYAETALLPYVHNIFGFEDAYVMEDWLTSRLRIQKLSITSLEPASRSDGSRIYASRCLDRGTNRPFSNLKIIYVRLDVIARIAPLAPRQGAKFSECVASAVKELADGPDDPDGKGPRIEVVRMNLPTELIKKLERHRWVIDTERAVEAKAGGKEFYYVRGG